MIEEAKELAKRFLDEKTYLHSQRVAAFTEENPMIPPALKEHCIALAWLHDLWEDSACQTGRYERPSKPERNPYPTFKGEVHQSSCNSPVSFP